MSVTFVVANDTDKSIVEPVTCHLCCGQDDDCGLCGGTGDLPEMHEESKYQLNMANDSFRHFVIALGMPMELWGEINPHVIMERLEAEPNEEGFYNCNYESILGTDYSFSVDRERMERYYRELVSVAQHAIELNEVVCWG